MSKPSFREMKMKFWLDHKRHCLFAGNSGVGKTEILRETLEKFGLKFGESVAYYSTYAGDFVGNPSTAEVVLFDNLNDSQARKAADEILGLRVWKGVPVSAFVWGCFQTKFDVELPQELSQQFQVVVSIPNYPFKEWFAEKFGERIAAAAIEWWDGLDSEMKEAVTPRILDNALTTFKERGDIRDCLPVQSNVAKLAVALNSGPVAEKLEALLKEKDDLKAAGFLANENNFAASTRFIRKSQLMMEYFLPLLQIHHLARFMQDDNVVFDYVLTHNICKEKIEEIFNRNEYPGLAKRIRARSK